MAAEPEVPYDTLAGVYDWLVDVADRLVEREGRRGLVIYAWDIAAGWDDRTTSTWPWQS